MARESREVWAKRIERLRASELTDAEFATEFGVNLHTLRSWKWKLKADERAAKPSVTTAVPKELPPKKRPSPAATFVEVAADVSTAGIELRVGDVEVRVPVGFDETTLGRVVALLRRSA